MYKSRSLNEINVKATHVNLRNLDKYQLSKVKSHHSPERFVAVYNFISRSVNCYFPLILGMVTYAYELQTKEKQKQIDIKD